jgi:predicted DNA-binding transcriptional regulator YafY
VSDDDARYLQLERLLELALLLQGSLAGCSIDDVVARFEVSRRTATRMLTAVRRALGDAHFEVGRDAHNHKTWRLTRPLVNGLFRLGAEDLAALDTAARLARREGERVLAREVDRVAAKLRSLSRPEWLLHVDPDVEALSEALGFAWRAGPRPRLDLDVLEQLRHAVLARRRVRVLHRKQPDSPARWQPADPLGFLYGNRHYLVAWSGRRRQAVLYRLSRIEKVELLDQGFDAPGEFSLETFFRRSFGVFQEEPVDVVWRFRAEAADEAAEHCFHPDQQSERLADGSLLVRFRAGGLQEMAWHLFSWGPAVEIVEPPALRALMLQMLNEALRSHGRERTRRVGHSSRRRHTAT